MGCCPGRYSPPTSPSCTTNCFKANNVTIECNALTPVTCGGNYTRDLADDNTDIAGCSNSEGACDIVYQLLSYTSHFSSVTLSATGDLVATRAAGADPNSLGIIRYRIYCACNNYSATARVYVCIDNLCANVLCPEDEECTQCDGCTPVVPNAILT